MINEMLTQLSLLDVPGLDSGIYETNGTDQISMAGLKLVKMIGGWGAIAFTLAVMGCALAIIFGSISSKNIGKVWTAFFSCLAGAVVFFAAYIFAPAIQGIMS